MAASVDTLSSTKPTSQWIGNPDQFGEVVFQITGTWTGTITFECCVPGNEATPVGLFLLPSTTDTAVLTTTANGLWRSRDGRGAGVHCRCNFTTPSSGNPVITAMSAGRG